MSAACFLSCFVFRGSDKRMLTFEMDANFTQFVAQLQSLDVFYLFIPLPILVYIMISCVPGQDYFFCGFPLADRSTKVTFVKGIPA